MLRPEDAVRCGGIPYFLAVELQRALRQVSPHRWDIRADYEHDRQFV